MLRLLLDTSRSVIGRATRRGATTVTERIKRDERRRRQRCQLEEGTAQETVSPGKGRRWRDKETIEYEGRTAPGDKKDTSSPLPAAYSPRYVEAAWYSWWVTQGFFKPEYQSRLPHARPEIFSLCIPPPNVTGSLHLGHALTVAIEDSLVRCLLRICYKCIRSRQSSVNQIHQRHNSPVLQCISLESMLDTIVTNPQLREQCNATSGTPTDPENDPKLNRGCISFTGFTCRAALPVAHWRYSHFNLMRTPPCVHRGTFCPPMLSNLTGVSRMDRRRRMLGQKVLWVPGSDHAGIATQTVVEKNLYKERGVSRHDLGREEFLKAVWEWKESKGDRIYHQLKSLGASLDWDRSCFTMDQRFSRAVSEAFIHLYESGLVCRRHRLVNWSCALQSAISDIEVESRQLNGKTYLSVPGYQRKVPFGLLFSFAYPTEEGDNEIIVATTRPETMLGDTAVAVHPDDPRYLKFHGKNLRHPFTGRLLPVVTHQLVNPEFGTGAVKVTPAHSLVDFEISQDLALPLVSVIGEDGAMTEASGDWIQGVKRFDAREQVVAALKEKGLYRGDCEHSMLLPVCSRSGDVIEHLLKRQWFVDCKEMALKALRAVESGRLEITPSYHQKNWKNWLSDISDWCISRQLWWGHQIPAYLVTVSEAPSVQDHKDESEGFWVAAHSESEARKKAAIVLGKPESELVLRRDEDVLDTWFSSALFPFAMLGWPQQTKDLEDFYPNSLLETGSDLLFFWVARMVMLGEQLTGQLPFGKVFLHSMVRDAHGRKMSKSLGNVLDPLDVMTGISLENLREKLKEGNLDPREFKVAESGLVKDYPHGIPECGTDALRFALCSHRVQGDDVNLDVAAVLAMRHFCNKVWNGVKFTLSALGEGFTPVPVGELTPQAPLDRWLLDRLRLLTEECERKLQSYEIHQATAAIHNFWVKNYCDVYVEAVKPILKGSDSSDAQQVLYWGAELTLRLLAPFTPYLSEELWQRLPSSPSWHAPSVCVAEYPSPWHTAHWSYPEEARCFDFVYSVVRTLRSLRNDLNLTKARPEVCVSCSQEDDLLSLQSFLSPLQTLSFSGPLHIHHSGATPPEAGDGSGWASGEVTENCHVYMNLKGLVDPSSQIHTLQAKLKKLENQLKGKMKEEEETEENSLQMKISRIRRIMKTLEEMP